MPADFESAKSIKNCETKSYGTVFVINPCQRATSSPLQPTFQNSNCKVINVLESGVGVDQGLRISSCAARALAIVINWGVLVPKLRLLHPSIPSNAILFKIITRMKLTKLFESLRELQLQFPVVLSLMFHLRYSVLVLLSQNTYRKSCPSLIFNHLLQSQLHDFIVFGLTARSLKQLRNTRLFMHLFENFG